MRERPILFSTQMVNAILAGEKTMTRRIVKFPKDFTGENVFHNGSLGLKYTSNMGGDTVQRLSCKHGEIGDKLWVRETFCQITVEDRPLLLYKADGDLNNAFDVFRADKPWRPSIYMPRSASRITLKITDVRAERLQSITEEDAQSEGVLSSGFDKTYRYSFSKLWESINGNGSWTANPWVWVIEFKRI